MQMYKNVDLYFRMVVVEKSVLVTGGMMRDVVVGVRS